MTSNDEHDDQLADVLEAIQDMRDNDGELDMISSTDLLPHVQQRIQRSIENHVRDLRQFGYTLQVRRDRLQRITGVRLLEQ
jgi:hypothetical protein